MSEVSQAEELNSLVKRYEVKDFILNDPIQFPHRYSKKEDIEISAFISSAFAYGNRNVFVKKLKELYNYMEDAPYNYILSSDFKNLDGFNYRFAKDVDIKEVLIILRKLYKQDGGLSNLFEYGWNLKHEIYPMFQAVTDYFYSENKNKVGQGFFHLIPNPKHLGTMKRMNMFMRWMVRNGDVDLGVWKFIKPKDLLIPMDVHVARISREMGLLTRKSNDYKAVMELTENLKKLDANDPVKYDFAMFGKGINKEN